MEPVRNPYSAGLSIPPPELAGREAVLAQARLLLGRLKAGSAEKSLLVTGLRGSGKTSLLNAIERLAAGTGVELKLVDEAQALDNAELGALLREQEQNLSRQRPQAVVLAGLPFQSALDDDGLRLAERHFGTFELGPLERADAAAALEGPAQALGAAFEPEALAEVLRQSKGYPAFLQAWAYEAWNRAEGGLIRRADVRACGDAVLRRLDRDFYGPGFERLSPREKAYLRTMAHLGPGPHRSGDIADSMDAKITSLGPLRAKLLQKGWVYSPAHGLLGFTAPGMDEFMRRVMPGFR